MDPEVRNRLLQLNPWLVNPAKAPEWLSRFLPPKFVERDFADAPDHADRARLIVGPRQAGKSSLVWHRLQRALPDLLFLNMEDPLLRSACPAPAPLIAFIRDELPGLKALFIDEAQHMEEAGLFVKGLVDSKLNIPIWVTGSSSFDLRSRTRESLAGRAIRCRLLPFSGRELLRHAAPPNPVSARAQYELILNHQLVFGSYPAVYLSAGREEKISRLSDLVEALILRDASDLFRIKRVDAFRRLLTLLAGQAGNLINASELAAICNVNVGTIQSYLEILEESHVAIKLPPFAAGKRREITNAPKVFFVDCGIRNQLLHSFAADPALRPDKGPLFENWVFSEIHKLLPLQATLKFWRSKAGAEVDFIIEHAGRVYALEVKWGAARRGKITRSARSFMEAYKPEKFAVLTMTAPAPEVAPQAAVDFIDPFGLPEWVAGIFR